MQRLLSRLLSTLALLVVMALPAMATNEIKASDTASKTVYAVIVNQAGQFWNGSTFEAYSDAHWATYAVTLSEQGTSSNYFANFPAGIVTSGRYGVVVYEQQQGSPAVSDSAPANIKAQGPMEWTGSTLATLAATQGRITTALPNAAPGTTGGLALPIVANGTAQAGSTSTTFVLAAGSPTTTDIYKGNFIRIISGTGMGQARTIIAYNGSTLTATLSRVWAVTPDNTSVYTVTADPHPALDSNLAVTSGTVSDKSGYTATASNLPSDYLSTAEQNHVANADTQSAAASTSAAAAVTAIAGLPTASANATATWAAGTRALTDKAGFGLSSGEYTNIVTALLAATVAPGLTAKQAWAFGAAPAGISYTVGAINTSTHTQAVPYTQTVGGVTTTILTATITYKSDNKTIDHVTVTPGTF